jgi:Zn-dependent protease with chaperone function
MQLSDGESPAADAAARTFSMPSETLLRFLVLTTGLVLSGLFLVESLYYTVHDDRERSLLTRCRAVASAAENSADAAAREAECRAPSQRDRVIWTSGVLPLTVAAGIGMSLALPWVRRRRRSLQLVPESLSMVHDGVASLRDRLAVSRTPRLWWQPRRVGGAATAFGLPTRPELEISPGTASLAITDRSRFDAIVAHELAHHRNRDVVLGAVAVGSLAAFAGTAVAPFMLGSLLSDVPIRVLVSAWVRVALVLFVTALVQRAVLRAREHEADLRATAAQVDMAPAIARMTLAKPPASRARGFLRELFATHPAPPARMAMTLHPMTSLIPSMLQCFAAGFFCFLSVPTISRLASAWLSGTPSVNEGMLWVATAFAALLGAWLAVNLRRAAALGSSRALATTGPGLVAGLGAVMGLVLLDAPLYQQVRVFPGGWTEIVAMVFLVVAFTALGGWLSTVGRLAEESALRWVSRYFVPATGAFAAAVVIAPLVRTLFFARITVQDEAPGGDNAVAFLQVLSKNIGTPTVMTLMIAALAVPLLFLELLIMRHRIAQRTARPWLRMLAVIPIGVGAGALGFWAYRLHEERLRRISTLEARETFTVSSRLLVGGHLLVAGGALIAALIVVLFGQRTRHGCALAAAVIASVVGASLTIAYQNSYGPNKTWSESLDSAAPIVAFGMMAALIVTTLPWDRAARLAVLTRTIVVDVVVVFVFLAVLPLAAWVAAPQGVLSEVVPFGKFAATDGADVLPLLDWCGENAVQLALSPEQAAGLSPFAQENLRRLDRVQFTSDTFREVTLAMSDATRWCASGLRFVAASRPDAATAEFRASLCRYDDALDLLRAVTSQVNLPRSLAVKEACKSATARPVP